MVYESECLRFTGRWNVSQERAVSTTPGAYFEFSFLGSDAIIHFDTEWLDSPMPHLWLSVDSAAMAEAQIDRHLRIYAPGDGPHTVKVIFKSAVEMAHRWYEPLGGRLDLVGIDAERFSPLPEDCRSCIEFVGDSITEGVLIDPELGNGTKWSWRPYEDDSTATYAFLTAELLGLRPLIVGYGGVGVTKGGSGGVPKGQEAYPYCYHNVPRRYPPPEYIVTNYGANDRFQTAEAFCTGYQELLEVVTRLNPKARVVVLAPFCGAHENELSVLAAAYAKTCNNRIDFVSTAGWVSPNPIHPNRAGHRIIARHLAEALRAIGIGAVRGS